MNHLPAGEAADRMTADGGDAIFALLLSSPISIIRGRIVIREA